MSNDVWAVRNYYLIGHFLGTSVVSKDSKLVLMWNKFYTSILCVLVICGSVFSLISRYNGYWGSASLSLIILESAEIIFEMFFMLFCFIGGLKYSKKWLEMFNVMEKIDEVLKRENIKVTTIKCMYLLKFMFFNVLYVAIHSGEIIMWLNRENFSNENGYFLYRIAMYYHFFVTFAALVQITLTENKQAIMICYKTKETSARLTKIGRLLWLLDKIIQNYNQIFGWTTFLGTTISMLTCFGDLNSIIQLANSKDESFNIAVAFVNGLYSALYLLSTITIVLSCNNVEKTAKKIILACYLKPGLLEKTPIRDDLICFAEFAEKLTPKFSAAGFFLINQNILSTLFQAIITYLIIIIQFNLAM